MIDGKTTYKTADINVMDNMFEKEGLVFAGWNTEATGKGKSYNAGDPISFDEADTVKLFEQWKPLN